MKIKIFVFNLFQVNTYVLYDESGECVIVDPGCYYKEEENELSDFISLNKLLPRYCLNTHAHIDHILGNKYVNKTYGIKIVVHPDSIPFIRNAPYYASAFGLDINEMLMPDTFYNEGDEVRFGNSVLRVINTPGHANGSVCLLSDAGKFLLSGDVLFYESIGRTDLPTGNLELLTDTIRNKLFKIPGNYIVYPGHGHETTINHEKLNNPFI